MERYSEYKDSGVKWLGEIPSHWEVKRLRAAITERKERFNSSESLMILSLLKDRGIIPYEEKGEIGNKSKDDYSQYKVARKGDLVINSMNVIIGSLGITPYDGYISPAYYAFKPNKDINLSYYNYILSLRRVQQSIRCFSKGIMEIRLKISAYDFLSMPFPFPNIDEQSKIANYLDSVTSKIDEAIAQQQKMIDLLNERKQIIINNAVTKGLDPNVKMKPSGVDWIGDIPEHWKIFRIRYNYYLKGRIGWQGLKADEFIDAGPYLVTGTDFVNGKVNWQSCYHITKTRFEEAPEIHVKKGDLLITKDGTVGKTAFIDEIPGPTSLNSHLLIVRPLYDKCNNTFLQYIINSDIFKSYMNIFQTGSIMASISQEKFSDFSFPLPPKQEQDVIIKYLNTKISKVDQTIENITKQISLLQERKQIIINDVVTGKVKVV